MSTPTIRSAIVLMTQNFKIDITPFSMSKKGKRDREREFINQI
jgi:hypothetical protein